MKNSSKKSLKRIQAIALSKKQLKAVKGGNGQGSNQTTQGQDTIIIQEVVNG